MNKVICDICGTKYPDTADQCPICGYAREIAGQPKYYHDSEDVSPERTDRVRTKGGKFSAENVRKRTQEETIPAARQQKGKFSDQSYENTQPESNPVLVVLLVILIMTLIATTAFIFYRYLLPNLPANQPETVIEQTEEPTEPEMTEEVLEDIPCEALALTSGGSILFTEEGQMSLLNLVVIPFDSTDDLVYSSDNEEVATVNDEGRVTAVGEGEAVITITCGKRQMQCNVTCTFATEATENVDAMDTENTGATEE